MHCKLNSYLRTGLITLIFLAAVPSLPVVAETQEKVKSETGFYYTVQEGDTLWELSRKFSDTPWHWPEMWKENDQIANPHRIYPGERIRLYRRRDVASYGDAGAGEESSGAESSGADKSLKDKPELTKQLHYDYAGINRVGFIRKEAVLAHGNIFKVEGRKEMISTGDVVYIRPRPNFSLSPGDKYTIYRTLQPIRDRKTHKLIGIQHYFTGAVEIMIKRPEFVLGRIIGAYRPIKIGDLLMPYNRRLQQIAMNPSPPGLEGSIIESEYHDGIFGENSVAFIDKGKSDGVETGQLYWIFVQEQYRINPDNKFEVTLTPEILGELLVLHTENTTSTVIITDSRKPIRAGAKIVTPFKLE